MTEPAIHELAREIAALEKQHAVLEERMNTKHAEYATAAEKLTGETRAAIERLEGETRAALERLRTDIARRDTHMVRTIYAAAGLAAVFTSVLIVFLYRL